MTAPISAAGPDKKTDKNAMSRATSGTNNIHHVRIKSGGLPRIFA